MRRHNPASGFGEVMRTTQSDGMLQRVGAVLADEDAG